MQLLQNCIGPTICSGQRIECLRYAWFFCLNKCKKNLTKDQNLIPKVQKKTVLNVKLSFYKSFSSVRTKEATTQCQPCQLEHSIDPVSPPHVSSSRKAFLGPKGSRLLLPHVWNCVSSYLQLIFHYRSVFTVNCSLFTAHCSLFTVHCALCTLHCALCTVQRSPSLLNVHCSSTKHKAAFL